MDRKRILSLFLAMAMSLGVVSTAFAASDSDFPDLDRKAWYLNAIEAAVDNDLLRGDDRGLMRPNDHLTRAEMAAVINRAFGTYKKTDISRFQDVKPTAWYYDDVRMAVQMGTYVGTSASTMAPDTNITRQEAMTVVARALQLDTEEYEAIHITNFRDYATVSSWALPYVKAMVGADYIHGNEKGELAPKDYITRAEFAQIFHNIIKKYIVTEGTYTEDYQGNLLIRTDDVTLKNMTIDGDLIIGCGAADGTVTLDNVDVTGRVVVWGGGTEAVYMNNGTDVGNLIVCRVDNPVKVIFDKDSTLTVYDKIEVEITDRAAAFDETEVIFYDVQDILDAIKDLDDIVTSSEIHCTIAADMFALVNDTKVSGRIDNNSTEDTYSIKLVRNDTKEDITEMIQLTAGQVVESITLKEGLPMGSYPCTAVVTRTQDDGTVAGTLELSVMLHVAYLWAR